MCIEEALSEDVLDRPMYIAADCARLVGLSAARVRRWLRGYSYEYREEHRRKPPVLGVRPGQSARYASFLDLMDLLFVERFLTNTTISLQKLRKALQEAATILDARHFARQSFFTDGSSIYLEVRAEGDAILELLSGGQWVIPEVIKHLAHSIRFDQTTQLARQWYPLGAGTPVVVDPLVSFGRPRIDGTGIATANVYNLYLAESRRIRPVSRWFRLPREAVEAAVAFEERLAA